MINYIEHVKSNAPIEYFDLQSLSSETSESVRALKNKYPFVELQPYFEFLSVYDGQGKNSTVDLYFGFFALSAQDIVLNVESLSEVRITCDDDYDEGHWTSFPNNSISETVFNARWFPFGADYGGNYLGIDLDPGENGRLGQIIVFGRDIDERVVIADSLSKFEQWLIDIVDSRQFTLDREVGLLLRLIIDGEQLDGTIQELSRHISSSRDSLES